MNKEVRIIGVPMDLGQGRRGVDMGPYALRYAGLDKRLAQLGIRVKDIGNLDVPVAEEAPQVPENGLRHLPVVSAVNQSLATLCAEAIEAGVVPLALGGDHSIAAGSVAGARAKGRVGVLWIDAHADFNTAETSPSKNLHGMPLAALVDGAPSGLAAYLNEERVQPKDFVLLGVRSLDAGERRALIDYGIEIYTMRDVDELGIAEVTRQVLAHFTRRGLERLHVSFDLDSLDPAIAPGVGTPVPGGLSYREAHLLMEMLADDERVGSADVVEINPILDTLNGTAILAVELVASLMGQSIL